MKFVIWRKRNEKLCQNQESSTVNSNIEDILGLSIFITANSNTSHAHE
jgi:hypothetical protein